MNDEVFVAFVCLMVFAIPIATLIGGVFLRASCALYNKMAGGKGSPGSVPEPLLGKAMGISFVTILVNAGAGYVLGNLAAGILVRTGDSAKALVAQLVSLPVSFVVMAGMNSELLPTTLTRGFLVALCYYLVVLFAFAVLAIVFGGLFFVGSLLE